MHAIEKQLSLAGQEECFFFFGVGGNGFLFIFLPKNPNTYPTNKNTYPVLLCICIEI
jgi:hypothetical protein